MHLVCFGGGGCTCYLTALNLQSLDESILLAHSDYGNVCFDRKF